MKLSTPVRIISSVAGVLACASLSFASVSHTPLKKVEGLLIHSSTSVSSFSIDEGRYVDCQQTNPSLSGVRCGLEGSQITLAPDNGEQLTIPLTSMSYFKTTYAGDTYNHYIYRGMWKLERDGHTIESEMSVDVIYIGTGTPNQVQGYLSISDLNVSEQLRGNAQP